MTRFDRRRVWLLVAVLALGATLAEANGPHGPARPEPGTKFERAVVRDCPLCIQEAHALASLPTPPLRLPGFSAQVVSAMARNGEVRFELLRGYRPGKVGEQFALRVSLFVYMGGGASPAPFRFASGTVDEEDLAVMVTAVAEVARALEAARPGPGSADTSEVQFQAGSVRIGGLVTQGGTVAYIQAGDREALPAPSLWDAISTLFFQATDVVTVGQVVTRAMTRIQELRGK